MVCLHFLFVGVRLVDIVDCVARVPRIALSSRIIQCIDIIIVNNTRHVSGHSSAQFH